MISFLFSTTTARVKKRTRAPTTSSPRRSPRNRNVPPPTYIESDEDKPVRKSRRAKKGNKERNNRLPVRATKKVTITGTLVQKEFFATKLTFTGVNEGFY